jgi:transcriptional regulator with XRE-family HTH domain
MTPVPPVLQCLKALGLSQKALAEYIGASPAAVSMWCTGKNPFGEPWQTEAEALLAVLHEHLAQGGTLKTFVYRPTVFLNPEGLVYTGEMPLRPIEEYVEIYRAVEGLSSTTKMTALEAWEAKTVVTHLAHYLNIDPLTWNPSARELDQLRRHIAALRNAINSMLRRKAHGALEEFLDADQTP